MRGRLLFLNLILLALIAAGAWRVRVNWDAARTREANLLRLRLPALAAAPALVAPAPALVSPADYVDVAARLLLSRDRHPNIVIDTPPPKPRPPLPRFYGAMDFGAGLSLVMSEGAGGTQRSYKVGEQIGEYRILAASPSGFVFEWDGQKIEVPLAELLARGKAQDNPAPGQADAAPPAAAAPAAVTQVTAGAAKPGTDQGSGFKACASGDNAPAGTVADGFRKVVATTPFGQACRWEAVK